LVEIPNGEHEVLMEAPEVRGPVFDQLTAHFQAAQSTRAPKPAMSR
jgi:lysophospholipase